LILPAICKGSGIVSNPTILRASLWRIPSVLATSDEGVYPSGTNRLPANTPKATRKNYLKLDIFPLLEKLDSMKTMIPGEDYKLVTVAADANKFQSERLNTAESSSFNLQVNETITCHDY
jgi:hypothetical protein